MIQLILHKFKCWDDLTIDFPINQITLLKGRSGVGKSTLLNAIEWVLYGEFKKVGPRHTPNAKTSVTLKTDMIQVTRTKNPNKLTLEHDSIQYEDVNAQTKINQMYGVYEIWLMTSYMKQICQNYFLMSANSAKIELLNKISFHDEDPNEYIDKIDKSLEQNKTLQQYKLELFNKKINLEYDESKIFNYNPEHLELLKIKELKFIDLKNKFDIQQGIKASKEEELKNLNMKLNQLIKPIFTGTLVDSYYHNLITNMNEDDLPLFSETCLQQLQEHMKELININHNLTLLNNIKIELEKYKNVILGEGDYTLTDLQESTANEKLYYDNEALFKSLDIDHDTVNDYIDHLNDVLGSQERLCKEIELDNLLLEKLTTEQELKNITNILSSISIDEPNDLEKNLYDLNLEQSSLQHQLQHLIDTKDAIKCPHCDQNVLYKKGLLIKVTNNNDIKNNIEQIENNLKLNQQNIILLKDNIEKLKLIAKNNRLKYEKSLLLKENYEKNYNKINTTINDLTLQISELPESEHSLLTNDEKNQIYKVLGRLKNIKIVTLPLISSETIKNYLNTKTLVSKKLALLEQYDQLSLNIPKIYDKEFNVDILKKYLTNYENYIHQYNYLKMSINQIVIGESLENPSEYLNNIQMEIKEYEYKINEHFEHVRRKEDHLRWISEKEELDHLTTKVDYLTQLKTRAINVECEILKNIVNNINFNMYDICMSMFEHDIKIDMELYKNLKNKKVKQDVNFNIIYKGCKFDSIQELSPGEQDRCSLSLTLALNKLSSSQLVIFDESMKSLNTELKQDIITTIKEHIHCTVLIVEHSGLEGVADHIIDVELL